MSSRFFAAGAVISVLAFASTSAWADSTIIGETGQSDSQGANSTQSDTNGASSSPTYIAGTYSDGTTLFIPGNSAPVATQLSTNAEVNGESIGGGRGDTTLIAPGASDCFCQGSQQAANSDQVGSTDLQILTQVVISDAEIGGGPSDTTQIGSANQTNQQGTNGSQSGGDTQIGLNVLLSATILGN